MHEPLVSVIIPAYNRPRYLREAIGSVLNQTYRNLELIVSDNSPVPDSRAVVEEFDDPRVRYLKIASDLGMADNNLVAFKASRGKYFANLHDDDVWHSDLLATLVPPLEAHPEAAIAFSDHYVMDQDGNIVEDATEANTRHFERDTLEPGLHQPFSRLALVAVSVPMVMATIIRRSAVALDEEFPKLPSCYDFWLTYLACRDGGAAYYVPERLMRYRWHPGNDTATGHIRIARSLIHCFGKFLEDERLADLHPEFTRLLGDAHTNLATGLLREGSPAEARPHLREGIRLSPSLRRRLIGAAVLVTPDPVLKTGVLRNAWPTIRRAIAKLRRAPGATSAEKTQEGHA